MQSPAPIPIQTQTPPSSTPTAPTSSPLQPRTRTTRTLLPTYTYLHLTFLSSRQPNSSNIQSVSLPPLDAITAITHLTSALRAYLGLHGTAIPIDILKIENRDAWVRCPASDGAGVVAALASWVGRGSGEEGDVSWRVRGRSGWIGKLLDGGSDKNGGSNLFGD
ncbi:hypothetical protein M501DRAFT_991378 [Patellaria atrata CBS 101060]|uniref:Ribonucleases P/MRP subunit Pop8-like domain-containing protein n=1 Tax=Patellaria atrata CBS 101060 TaxID=1346257 RepID=A0A9P4SD19_9PEZI|nr:hypothetical protein M501DRAFT_991378 [Patellaria atrata CBS 101060]